MTRKTTTLGACAFSMALLAGCGGGAQDGRNPMGSQAMVSSADYSAIFVASPDDDVVARVDANTLEVRAVSVSGEPTRVARIGDRVLVTQRAERRLLELVDDGEALRPARSVDVGPEPYGVVATEDGTRVYLAESMADRVLELDGESLETLRVWQIDGEPRWLALHPSAKSLYVATAAAGGLYHVNLETGAAMQVDLPQVESFDFRSSASARPTVRITGDPAASPNGRFVAVPTMYVDNTTPLSEPGEDPPSEPGSPVEDSYGARMNPSVVLLPTKGDGSPEEEEVTFPIAIPRFTPTGYPSSVTFSPSGDLFVITMEGTRTTLVFETEPDTGGGGPFDFGGEVGVATPGGPGGFEPRAAYAFTTPAGPRAVAFTSDDRAFVYGFLDRAVAALPMAEARANASLGGFTEPALRRVEIAQSNLPEEVEIGRRLFYASDDPRVAQVGGAVSCATCHFEGRDDGLTWSFDRGPRQTPSLAGMVSLREPVRWAGDRATVADDAFGTSQGLMGGSGLTMRLAQMMAAFIDSTRAVDHPGLGADDPAVARGREIFEREDVGCAGCHSGPLYTDKLTYSMFGFEGVKTPSLLGIAATAPYLHDGSAPTLRAVLDAARGGGMGDTSGLSEAELADLEAFLRSL